MLYSGTYTLHYQNTSKVEDRNETETETNDTRCGSRFVTFSLSGDSTGLAVYSQVYTIPDFRRLLFISLYSKEQLGVNFPQPE